MQYGLFWLTSLEWLDIHVEIVDWVKLYSLIFDVYSIIKCKIHITGKQNKFKNCFSRIFWKSRKNAVSSIIVQINVCRSIYMFMYCQEEYHDALMHWWIVPPLSSTVVNTVIMSLQLFPWCVVAYSTLELFYLISPGVLLHKSLWQSLSFRAC